MASGPRILSWLAFFALLAGAGWYFRDLWMPPAATPVVAPPVVQEEPVADTGPRHPIGVPLVDSGKSGEAVPLPALDDSDAYFLLDVGNVFGKDIESLLLREGVIDRLVATVDTLPRKKIPESIRPVRTLATPFLDGPGNYSRYDALVAYIAAADLDAMVDMYERYYPLFQQAYRRLGYPDGYFNDRLVEVIDHLLDTPETVTAPELMRPNVLYEYADPNLESLSSGQKLLLRMGNDHAASLKDVLRQLRSRIASS